MFRFGRLGVGLDVFLGNEPTVVRISANYLGAALSHWMSPVGEIIQLGLREQEVWKCQCGNHTFWLYSGGDIVCSECEKEAVGMSGYWRIPSANAQDNPRLKY